MSRFLPLLLFIIVYFALDFYVFQSIKLLLDGSSLLIKRFVLWGYWVTTILILVGVIFYGQLDPEAFKVLRVFLFSFFFINVLSKLFIALVLAGDDIRRGVSWIAQFFTVESSPTSRSRSEFITKGALVAGAVPLVTLSFGIISGAHDYRVRKRVVTFPNLPKEFDGIRLAQLSDIHTGSFFNKTAVAGGVDMVNAEKPDLICFTGDLVNNQSDEAKEYLDIFKKLEAPLGVHSIMGNHDYADYSSMTPQQKEKDRSQLHEMHRYMNWNIMLNENQEMTVDGSSIGLMGCENWGAGRFSKYGDLAKTYEGMEEQPFKILMSHDPSHWDAQIRPEFGDIDLTLAGHTHGMQLGIEIGDFRWSPSKYIYKQWADLYQEGSQYLYVNRGYGYIGYPGRIGILPEITILELKRG